MPGWYVLAKPALACCIAFCSPAWSAGTSWHLDKNYISLHADNRYFDTLEVVNESSEMLYIKASVSQLQTADGVRTTAPATAETLLVSPDEFVVRPGASFPVRVLANANAQSADSRSYYVRLTDVSKIREAELKGGMVSGFAIAYEALTVVKKTPYESLAAGNFSVHAGPVAGDWVLNNLSGQHVFLSGGYECATDRQRLIDCAQILDFPRQSLLPGESVAFSARLSRPFLGLLVNADLGFRLPVKAVYLPMTQFQHADNPQAHGAPSTDSVR